MLYLEIVVDFCYVIKLIIEIILFVKKWLCLEVFLVINYCLIEYLYCRIFRIVWFCSWFLFFIIRFRLCWSLWWFLIGYILWWCLWWMIIILILLWCWGVWLNRIMMLIFLVVSLGSDMMKSYIFMYIVYKWF